MSNGDGSVPRPVGASPWNGPLGRSLQEVEELDHTILCYHTYIHRDISISLKRKASGLGGAS